MISCWLFLIATVSLVLNLVRFRGVSIPDAAFFAALIFIFIGEGIIKKAPVRSWLPSHPLLFPAFLILIGGLIASINAFSISSSIGITLKQFYIFSIFTCIGIVMTRQMNPNYIVTAIIISGLITSISAINDYLLGYKLSNELLMRMGSIPLNESWDRYAGLLGHPNEQAMFLAVILPLVFSRLMNSFEKKVSVTILNSSVLLIISSALFLTGSISGYLGAIVAIIICLVWFLFVRSKNELFIRNFFTRTLIGNFFLLVFFGVIINTSLGQKVSNTDFFSLLNGGEYFFRSIDRVVTTTAITRWDDFILGYKYIISNPLIGAGMDQGGTGGLDQAQLVTSLAIHNTIFQSWVSGGLLTFLGTILIYLQVLKTSLQSIFSKVSWHFQPIIVGLAASSLGFVIIDMTSSNIYQRIKWLIFSLLLGLISLKNEYEKNNLVNLEKSEPR